MADDTFTLLDKVDLMDDIEAFHEKFGQGRTDLRALPLDEDLFDFRVKFMQEELDEYIQIQPSLLEGADGEPDPTREQWATAMHKQLDALVDLTYVVLGTAYLQFGPRRFKQAWRRVQAANMAKVRKDQAGAGHTDSGREPKYDIVKPEGWVEPDHRDLVLEGHE